MKLLDTELVREAMGGSSRACLDVLEVFTEVDSTNSYLLDKPPPAGGRYRVALAEYQTAGRGRLDKRWQSPPSSGICLSIAYTFQQKPEHLPSLTLAIGIGVVAALNQLGAHGLGVKWPNDIVVQNAKLGGILTEVLSEEANAVTVVVGIGLNVDIKNASSDTRIWSSIGNVTDLVSCTSSLPSRSAIAAAVIDNMYDTLVRFESGGLKPFLASWRQNDWLCGQRVTVELADGVVAGIADGVDTDGALILSTGSEKQRIVSGRVILGEVASDAR